MNLSQTKALEWGEKITTGVIYEEDLLVYEEQLPALRKGPLVTHRKSNPDALILYIGISGCCKATVKWFSVCHVKIRSLVNAKEAAKQRA